MEIILTNRFDKSWRKVFPNRAAAVRWIKTGIEWSEGSEQTRYYRVLWKLVDAGKTVIDLYDEV